MIPLLNEDMLLGVCLYDIRNIKQRKEPKVLKVNVVVNNNYIENILLLLLLRNSETQICQKYVGDGFAVQIHLTPIIYSHDLSRSTRDCQGKIQRM